MMYQLRKPSVSLRTKIFRFPEFWPVGVVV